MADMRRTAVVCDDRCGCPSPCPGGHACRCRGGDAAVAEHKECSCGEHCGCNPCTCLQSSTIQGRGKAFCKCGEGCTCVACVS